MPKVYGLIAAGLVAALLGALAYMVVFERAGGERFAQCREGSVAGGSGALGGPFELVDHHGHTVTDVDVLTRPSLIYFGYTFCPDVCPLDVARNAIAVEMLEAEGVEVQPVFISIDPGRDTPEVLAAFASNMHPSMVALTGTTDQVRAAALAYRVFYQKHDAVDDFYLVDHSTFSYLVLPGHGFVEVFRRDLEPRVLADRMACFIAAA